MEDPLRYFERWRERNLVKREIRKDRKNEQEKTRSQSIMYVTRFPPFKVGTPPYSYTLNDEEEEDKEQESMAERLRYQLDPTRIRNQII